MTSEQYDRLRRYKQERIKEAIIRAMIKKAYFNIIPPQPENRKGCLLMVLLLIFISIIAWIILR